MKFNIFLSGILLMHLVPSMSFAQEKMSLLVRADDMGSTYDKNLAIIKGHREGIITSASVMPTSAFFPEAVKMCSENPSLAVGIHLTVLASRERPVLHPEEVPSLVTPKGFFYENAEQLEAAEPKEEEIKKELRAQIGKVREAGLHFVYLDWHRGVPQIVRNVIRELCREEQVIFGQDHGGELYGYTRIKLGPSESWPNMEMPDGKLVYYSAPALDEEKKQSFWEALEKLEPGNWMTNVHPGLAAPERASITELLCDPRTKEIIERRNIKLVSYYDLWEKEYGHP